LAGRVRGTHRQNLVLSNILSSFKETVLKMRKSETFLLHMDSDFYCDGIIEPGTTNC
jgi:hypothetical protein